MLLEEDSILGRNDIDGICRFDAVVSPIVHGENDASEFIYFSCHCEFHCFLSFLVVGFELFVLAVSIFYHKYMVKISRILVSNWKIVRQIWTKKYGVPSLGTPIYLF